jgi:hypothetical protein
MRIAISLYSYLLNSRKENEMPKSAGGLVSWLIGTLLVVAVGVAILARTPLWVKLFPAPKTTA